MISKSATLLTGTYFRSQVWKQFFTCLLELLTIKIQADTYFDEVLSVTDSQQKNTKYYE